MDAITAISERKGMRKFHDQSLPKVILENILDLATKAPSCKNRQPWKFKILQGQKIIDLADIVKTKKDLELDIDLDSLLNSSAVILIFNRLYNESGYTENQLILDSMSIGTAIQNILLVSQTFKLGSLLISDFIELNDEISAWLDEETKLVCGILIGFPDEDPKDKPTTHYSKISEWYE